MHIILLKLDTDIPENLLDFRGQTVYDTSSSFFGISKIKTLWTQYLQEAQKLLQSLCKDLSLFLPVWQLPCKTEIYILI